MYLIIDTETSGLPYDFSAPISRLDNWPRVIWLGFILLDENLEIIREGNYYINPGMKISENVAKVLGISDEIVQKYGNPTSEILHIFKDVCKNAKYLIGHNLDYDYKVISAEIIRNNFNLSLKRKKRICTMINSKEFVNKKSSDNKLTYPKLSDLFKKLYEEDFFSKCPFDDVKYAVKCFIKMREKEMV